MNNVLKIGTKGSAQFSECGEYRYQLWRTWDFEGPRMLWVMLNPSTADADEDDPTIRRCVGFSKSNGYGSMIVVNLFALRATDPEELLNHRDPIGPENDEWIARAVNATSGSIVVAWGAHNMITLRSGSVLSALPEQRVMCLGVTKSGEPRHPLYISGATKLMPYTPDPNRVSYARWKGGY